MSNHVLAGRTCLVTGASRGLGREIARRFWSEGANVILAVRQPESVTTVIEEEDRASNQSLLTLQLDLLDAASVKSLVSRARDRGIERLDVLVNNAAVLGPIGEARGNTAEEWEQTVIGDLVAPAVICNSAIPWMARSARAKIINLSGGGATGPRPNFSAYAAAKAGLVRFSETLALEVRDLGIDVNCVAPGPMGTDMLAAIEQAGARIAGAKELAAARKARQGGESTLQAAVELILFLASEHSNGITGKLIAAIWDNWPDFPEHLDELDASDVYTLRRITGRDRGLNWCDR